MSDRYNPFGLPYLDAPAERPNYAVDSRWPDQPSVADAFQMGHLANTDQYSPQTYAPFDTYDRAQQQAHRDERQQQAMQRSADVARALAGQGQGPADIRTPAAGMRMGDLAGEMLAPEDVFSATTLFSPKRLGAIGKAIPAAAGAVLGADEAQARTKYLNPSEKLVQRFLQLGDTPKGVHGNWMTRYDQSGMPELENMAGRSGGYSLVKGSTPVDEMSYKLTGLPKNLDAPTWDIAELRRRNAAFVLGPTDRIMGGGTLVKSGDTPLKVKQEGGANFAQMHRDRPIPGMPDDVVPLYASVDNAATTKALNRARDVMKEGYEPWYAPVLMNHAALDSTKQMAKTVNQALQHAKVNPELIDNAVRPFVRDDYPGFASKDFPKWLDNAGLAGRGAFVKAMSSSGMMKNTGVDIGSLRYANTDPGLRHTPTGSAGAVIGRMRPDVGFTNEPLHSNYGTTFMGQRGEVGKLAGNVPFPLLFPDIHRGLLPKRLPEKMGGGSFANQPAYYALNSFPKDVRSTQPVTDEVVDNVSKWFEKHPQGWSLAAGLPLGAGMMGGTADQGNY